MRPWTNKSLGCGILGLFLVALGISLCFLWPIFFHHILQKELALSPTSESFKIWSDSSKLSTPLFLKIYLFNWTNPNQLGIKKPYFDQVGPYCFREVRQKVNITFHHENKTVSYFLRRLWYFEPELSNGSLSDIVTQLDTVAASAVHKIRYWDYEWQKTLSYVLSTRQLYIQKTVDELLFTGYTDSLLSMGKLMITDPSIPTFDRFGWFYTRNGSSTFDGHFNMETGEGDIGQLGILREWNYRDTIKFYKSPCNVLEGSAGEFWPPGRTKDSISLFVPEMCRELFYEYEKTTSHFDIEGYRYTIGKKTLGNATKRRYPHDQAKFFEQTTTTEDFFSDAISEITTAITTESSTFNIDHLSENMNEYSENDPDVINMGNCYCNGECTPSGLLNVTACRYGAPVFVSLPHFHKTDPSVLDAVEGLRPNDEDHSFAITLEPTTGIPLEVSAVFQVNIHLHPSEIVTLFHNVPNIYMPMMWVHMKVEISKEMASNLKILLALPTVMLCGGIVMTIIGLVFIAVVAILPYIGKKRRVPPTDVTMEKMVDSPEKKAEMVYMDKTSNNEDNNVKSDRRLYAKQ
ncbi:protein peste [Anoplolepis gracilipes]|uniref:protein peste n=1 Tax=Anoplolepis gracilipes TaxID=354296 RepID=UPI003BA16B86